jgi:hypothetical protein
MSLSFRKILNYAAAMLMTTALVSSSRADDQIEAGSVSAIPPRTFRGVQQTLYDSVRGWMTETAVAIQFDAPAAPSDCKVRTYQRGRYGVRSTTISWTDNSDNETGFTLEVWQKVQGSLVFLGSVDLEPNTTEYGFIGIFPYQYRVRAYNAEGDSDWSNWAR